MTALSLRLPSYAVFAAMLSVAGLPIYIFAPKFFADTYGVSLAALGALLFALRLVDVVQDPVLGWVSERLSPRARAAAVWGAILAMSLSMIGLFAVSPPLSPLMWFGVSLTILFTSFSFLTICFYGAGVAKGDGMETGGHLRLAAWRETGGLIGVCLAAVAPTVLMTVTDAPFTGFALGFAGLCLIAAMTMRGEWAGPAQTAPPTPLRVILADPLARRLLILALVNAMPLAVTSTLFLFFVENRLDAPGWEGPLLVLFFLSAAVCAPFWGKLAARFGAKPVLLAAMALAILSFAIALTLGPGWVGLFAVVCVLSGATIGADLTLLPALFSGRLARIAPGGVQGFGLWGFVNKFSLALAALALLPLLENAGFVAGGSSQPAQALTLLTVLYAGLPLLLKLAAMTVLAATNLGETP